MITEFVVAATGYYAYQSFKKKDITDIKKRVNLIFEDNNQEYKVINVVKSAFGYKCIVDIQGLGYYELAKEKYKDILKSEFDAEIDLTQNEDLKTATLAIITEKLNDKVKFKPVTVKPCELYIGKTYTMEDIILSMKDMPHVLYTGINSSGKTYCVLTALTNLIYNFSDKEFELYISMISAKKDLRKFKDCIQCHGYADTLEKTLEMLGYLYHVMNKRIKIFNKVKGKYIDTIWEWNEFFPKKKMRIIYFATDEFTAFMPDNLDNDKNKRLKKKCLDLLLKLIQQCRCAGIYIITSLQRPDKESLPPRIKGQFNCKISFKQSNIASSLVVCDTDRAFNLKPKREALVSSDNEYIIKTLYLDNDMIQSFTKDKIDLSHRNYFNLKPKEITHDKKDVKSNSGKKDKEKISKTKKVQKVECEF